jgi:hypothetical protein
LLLRSITKNAVHKCCPEVFAALAATYVGSPHFEIIVSPAHPERLNAPAVVKIKIARDRYLEATLGQRFPISPKRSLEGANADIMISWSDWDVPPTTKLRGRKVKIRPHFFTTSFDSPHDAVQEHGTYGDEAKPPGVGDRWGGFAVSEPSSVALFPTHRDQAS